VIPAALARNARVFAHRFETSCIREPGAAPYWRDVGTLDAYWAANLDLARVQPELDMYDESWPVRTLQQQRPPAKFILGSPTGRPDVQCPRFERLHHQWRCGAQFFAVLGCLGRAGQHHRGFGRAAARPHRPQRAASAHRRGQVLQPAGRLRGGRRCRGGSRDSSSPTAVSC
jgi:hypothetical protein